VTISLRQIIRECLLSEASFHIHINNLTRALKEDDCSAAKESFFKLVHGAPPGVKIENELRLTKSDYNLLVQGIRGCALETPRAILGVTKSEKPKSDVFSVDSKRILEDMETLERTVANPTSIHTPARLAANLVGMIVDQWYYVDNILRKDLDGRTLEIPNALPGKFNALLAKITYYFENGRHYGIQIDRHFYGEIYDKLRELNFIA